MKKKNFESKLLKFRSELEVLNKEEMQDAFGGSRYGSSGGGGGGPADGGAGSYGGVSVGPTFAGGANGGGSATSVAMSTYVSPADTSNQVATVSKQGFGPLNATQNAYLTEFYYGRSSSYSSVSGPEIGIISNYAE